MHSLRPNDTVDIKLDSKFEMFSFDRWTWSVKHVQFQIMNQWYYLGEGIVLYRIARLHSLEKGFITISKMVKYPEHKKLVTRLRPVKQG